MKSDLSGEQALAAPQSEATAPALSIADIVTMLLARKWFIASCMLICALISYAYVKVSTPMYEATASIRLDAGRAGSLGLSDPGGPAQDSSDLLRTEVAIMQSDAVSISALNSLSDREFQEFANVSKAAGQIPANIANLNPQQERLIGQFKSQTQVKPISETQLVAISFKDKDPHLAATIVNHIVDTYLKQNFDSRFGSVTQIQNWLAGQMNGLKSNATASQAKLSEFEEQHNIIATGSAIAGGQDVANTTTDRLRLLNDRLAAAEADRITKEAQLKAAATGTPSVLASLFPDPKFQTLQTQQGTLTTEYTKLAAKFGPSYAPLVQMKAQLQAIDAEINSNVRTVQSRLREEYDASKATEDMLRKEYAEQTGKAYALNRAQSSLSALQAEGSASSQLYNTLQAKLQQASVDAGLAGINVMRVDIARAPLTPLGAGKATTVSVAAVFGLVIGIAAVFIVELMSDTLQSATQLGTTMATTVLGSIPHDGRVRAAAGSISGPAVIAFQDPQSTSAEAYRRLRNLLLESPLQRRVKTLLITSATKNEGKTTTAANLAVVLAQAGARVLLVDVDLFAPSLHHVFGSSGGAGLSEALQSQDRQPNFNHPLTTLPNLSVLFAGDTTHVPPDALTKGFRALLEAWAAEFDYVLIKSAPLLRSSGVLLLAKWSDSIVLVARRDVTILKNLKEVSSTLHRLHADLAGVVMNDVKDDAHGKGHYESFATATAGS